MPRKGLYSYEAIFDVLKDMPIFYDDGHVKKSRDPVWKTVCSRLPGMNLHNVYIFVMQDRKQIKTNLMKYLNITLDPNSQPPKPKKREPTKKVSYSKWDDYDYYDQLDQKKSKKDDLELLISLKNDGCKRIFQKVGLLPYTVIYFHPKQVELWNDLINVKSTVSLIVLNNLIDNASGKVESDNIFLYALAIRIPSSVALLAQMISDSTDVTEIQNFFNCWLQNKATAPSEIVVGYSQILLDATSLAFNFCTFDEYNLRCYNYIMKTVSDKPTTLILIDIVGIIKIVDSWKSFENILQTVKDFYLCSIMYLSTLNDFDVFCKAVISIFTLSQSPFQNEETVARKDSLWEELTSKTIERMNQQYINYVTTNGSKSYSFLNLRQNSSPSSYTDEIYEFINQLKQQAFELCDFSLETEKTPNDFYCPIILEDLIQLLVKFPSWTKLVVSKPDCSNLVSYCSSKHLESLKDLKIAAKPPLFLEYHLKKLQSITRTARNYVRTCKASDKYVVKEFKNNHSHLVQLTHFENVPDDRIEINIPGEAASEQIENEYAEDINMEDISDQKIFYSGSSDKDLHNVQFHAADSNNDLTEEFDLRNSSARVYKEFNKIDSPTKKILFGDSSHNESNSDEINLEDFKAKIYSTVNSLLEFDDFVDNELRLKMKSGQEKAICQVFLDCCKEMVTYEKFLGEMARRLCTSDETFSASFEQLFTDCYLNLESFHKHETKNISELFGYLLSLDCISWEIFSIVKLNEKDADPARRNFIRALLQNLHEQLGAVKLCKKLREKKNEPSFEGLFPINSKDALFAGNFFRLSGLKDLGNEISLSTINKNDSRNIKPSVINVRSIQE